MQLIDTQLREYLDDAVREAWGVSAIRPDPQRVANDADQLPKARIQLLPGQSVATGGAVAAKETLLPHTYEITGIFAYPEEETTIADAAVAKWNLLMYQLTAYYPHFRETEHTYSEEVGWDWEDNADERTYSVTLTFTINVISPTRTTGIFMP